MIALSLVTAMSSGLLTEIGLPALTVTGRDGTVTFRTQSDGAGTVCQKTCAGTYDATLESLSGDLAGGGAKGVALIDEDGLILHADLESAGEDLKSRIADIVGALQDDDPDHVPDEGALCFDIASEVVIYAGHARYGTGPDFDDKDTTDNYTIKVSGKEKGDGTLPFDYALEVRSTSASPDNRRSVKYGQCWVFSGVAKVPDRIVHYAVHNADRLADRPTAVSAQVWVVDPSAITDQAWDLVDYLQYVPGIGASVE